MNRAMADRMRTIISRCEFRDWILTLNIRFIDAPYLTVRDPAWPEGMQSRKWQLSVHMTDSEIVQTCFKAVLTALEHEAREAFLYGGEPVFGPHFDVDDLHELSMKRRDAGARR